MNKIKYIYKLRLLVFVYDSYNMVIFDDGTIYLSTILNPSTFKEEVIKLKSMIYESK